MLHRCLVYAFFLCSILLSAVDAGPFGVKSKDVGNDEPAEHDALPVDIDDEELLEAMEQFALMSESERAEAFAEVMDMLGGDEADPETVAAMKKVMEAVELMDEADDASMGYGAMSMEEEIAEAAGMALDMIASSEWELIRDKQDDILEALIVSGKIGAEEAALFRSDNDAWERELRTVWDELRKQAEESSGSSAVGDEL